MRLPCRKCRRPGFVFGTFGLVAALLLLSVLSAAAQDEEKAVPQPVRDMVNVVASDDERDVSAFEKPILFLARIRGDSSNERLFYLACLDRIAEAGSKESLPVLEALLNSQDYWETRSPLSPMLFSIHSRASEIWYDIAWVEATEEEKVAMALYAVQEDPPVKVDQGVGRTRLLQLGPKARPAFYQTIKEPDRGFDWDPTWLRLAGFAAAHVLDEEAFRPTDEEVDSVLKHAGAFGRYVMVNHLASRGDPRAIPVLLDLMAAEADAPMKLYLLLDSVRDYAQVAPEQKQKLVQATISAGRRAQQHLFEDRGWMAVLSRTNYVLHQLGPMPAGMEYLKGYRTYREALDLSPLEGKRDEHRQYYLENLQYADKYAEDAMEQWRRDE